MKLYASTRSPFCRKVFVAIHELGLQPRIEVEAVSVSWTQTDAALLQVYPLGQIPVLRLQDGRVLADSLVICEYLDALDGAPRLLPANGAARWAVLSQHALGQALLETLVKLFAERKRAGDPLQPHYVAAFRDKFRRVLPGLDEHYAQRGEAAGDVFDLGDIAIAGALAYADFRFPDLAWRSGHPALAAAHARMEARPSMRASALSGEGLGAPAAPAGPSGRR